MKRSVTIPTSLTIPYAVNDLVLELPGGSSKAFVGPNGAGKTRLGVHIEQQLPLDKVHRIPAQKSLRLNQRIDGISLSRATGLLLYGREDERIDQKFGSRWGNQPATYPVNDFDYLQQSLFAEHYQVASDHLEERAKNLGAPVPVTKLQSLIRVWNTLLPHRSLVIRDSSIRVHPHAQTDYPGGELSDGERVIFYFLGQSLLAPESGVVIVDEPENHVHKAIVGPLWDAIEAMRPDCDFIYFTHDLTFASEQKSRKMYFVRAYSHATTEWDIETVPIMPDVPESVIIEVLGSRKPVLFVEGQSGSLDVSVLRNVYSEFTLYPIGSCTDVINSVASFNQNRGMHRFVARGLIDADGREEAEISKLSGLNVAVLPVSEIENVLLLESVFLELAKALHCQSPASVLSQMKDMVFSDATQNLDQVCCRHTVRQIDQKLKKVGIDSTNLQTLTTSFQTELGTINPTNIYNDFRSRLQDAVSNQKLDEVLRLYDNKGMLARAAPLLGIRGIDQLLSKVKHVLADPLNGKLLRDSLAAALPRITI